MKEFSVIRHGPRFDRPRATARDSFSPQQPKVKPQERFGRNLSCANPAPNRCPLLTKVDMATFGACPPARTCPTPALNFVYTLDVLVL